MPSRAYTSFLRISSWHAKTRMQLCQCPLGLIHHFYSPTLAIRLRPMLYVSMPSRAYTSFLLINNSFILNNLIVSMPSRAYTSFLLLTEHTARLFLPRVNALSGLYIISTKDKAIPERFVWTVSMPSRAYTSFLPRILEAWPWSCHACVNALSGLYIISTCGSICSAVNRSSQVSMPSRAYTSFLRYPFKNLGFMRFPEPVFAGICQNILTTAAFRAC